MTTYTNASDQKPLFRILSFVILALGLGLDTLLIYLLRVLGKYLQSINTYVDVEMVNVVVDPHVCVICLESIVDERADHPTTV